MKPKSILLLEQMIDEGIIPMDTDLEEMVSQDEEITKENTVDPDTVIPTDEEKKEEIVEEVSGNESLSGAPTSYSKAPASIPFFIFRPGTDNNPVKRMWIVTDGIIDSNYINSFCSILDNLTSEEHLIIYFGSEIMAGNTLKGIGSLVSSIIRCKAKVTGIANGLCGLFETALFCFCHERIMRQFGQITIESSYLSSEYPTVFGPIIDTIFERADAIGLLDFEDFETLIQDNGTVIVTPDKFNERHNSEIK